MKNLITNYTFNAAAKQITLLDYTSINLESILLVTNVTDNIIIYNFADPNKGGTVSGNTITLTYNTNSMSNTDDLQIFIDDGVIAAKDQSILDLSASIDDNSAVLRKIASMMQSLAIIDTASRQRIVVDAFNASLPVNQSVNISQIGGLSPFDQIINETRTSFGSSTRPNLIVT